MGKKTPWNLPLIRFPGLGSKEGSFYNDMLGVFIGLAQYYSIYQALFCSSIFDYFDVAILHHVDVFKYIVVEEVAQNTAMYIR